MMQLITAAVVVIGAVVGFLGGLFGKGGSAVATPLLHAVGVPALVAVATPLPATVPGTLVASWPYWRRHLVDGRIVLGSIAVGAPATVLGALVSDRVGGPALVAVTDLILAGLGLRLLLRPSGHSPVLEAVAHRGVRIAAVAAVAGLTAGLLANSGGLLLAPLYLAVLKVDIKTAFACSLVVSAGLAVPGTVAHAALGHLDWSLVVAFGVASVPLSYLGARLALRTEAAALERGYGGALVVLGVALLLLLR